MKLNISNVKEFMNIIDSCISPVYLTDWQVDNNGKPNVKINLKSELSKYLGIMDLLSEHGDWFEIYTANREDESKIMAFIEKQM